MQNAKNNVLVKSLKRPFSVIPAPIFIGMNSSRNPVSLDVIVDFHVNIGTKIAITLGPLTFILSPAVGGEGRVRGM